MDRVHGRTLKASFCMEDAILGFVLLNWMRIPYYDDSIEFLPQKIFIYTFYLLTYLFSDKHI